MLVKFSTPFSNTTSYEKTKSKKNVSTRNTNVLKNNTSFLSSGIKNTTTSIYFTGENPADKSGKPVDDKNQKKLSPRKNEAKFEPKAIDLPDGRRIMCNDEKVYNLYMEYQKTQDSLVNKTLWLTFENYSNKPMRTVGNFYDAETQETISKMASDKNILVTKDEKAPTKLFTEMLTKKIKQNKFSNLGFDKTTNVYYLENFNDLPILGEDADPSINLRTYLKKLDSKNKLKKIVIIDNYETYLKLFNKNSGQEKLFERVQYDPDIPNIRILGIVNKKVIEPNNNPAEKMFAKIDPDDYKYVRKVNLPGLGAKETKEFFKLNKRQLSDITRNYENVVFDITDGAVDAVIDHIGPEYQGSFPPKAFNAMDIILAQAAAKAKQTEGQGKTKVLIDKKAVDRIFKNEAHIFDYLKDTNKIYNYVKNVETRFTDIGGTSEAKEKLKDLVEFAKNPAKYLKENEFPPRGALLEGPPGCAKTQLAKAVAGEANIPFFAISASEVFNKFLGQSEENVRNLARDARQAAIDSGKNVAIVFIDEIDAMGKERGASASSDIKDGTLNQLLTEIEGFKKDKKVTVLWMAATNRADILDPALKRRFDIIKVDLPKTSEERLEILKIHARKLPFQSEQEKDKMLTQFSKTLSERSGDDCKKLLEKTMDIVRKRDKNKFITYDDMMEGYMRLLFGAKTKTTKNSLEKEITVMHEFGHALLTDTISEAKLSGISNESRAGILGVTLLTDERSNEGFESVIKDLAMSHAGGDAENTFFNNFHDSGVSADYRQKTIRIKHAILGQGLGIHTPQISFLESNGQINTTLMDLYKNEIKKDIELYTEMSSKVSKKILDFYKGFGEEYLETYRKASQSDDGGNFFSGEEFANMRKAWLKKTGKEKEEAELMKNINEYVSHKNVLKREVKTPILKTVKENLIKLAKKSSKNKAFSRYI